MELKNFKVQGFRCIAKAELKVRNVTSVIGPNNAGKSSILQALGLFLETSGPDPGDWPRQETEEMTFEAVFGELTTAERASPALASLVYNNEVRIRVRHQKKEKTESHWECWRKPEKIEGWSEKFGECAAYIQTMVKALGLGAKDFTGKTSVRESIRQAIRDLHPDKVTLEDAEAWISEGFSITNSLQQAFPRPCFIPAVTDAAEEASVKAGTAFQQLLASAVLPAVEETPEFQGLVEKAKQLGERLENGAPIEKIEAVKKDISSRLADLIPAKILLSLRTPDANKYIGANVGLRLDDGGTTDIERQGHGLQRALIFAMLEHLAERQKSAANGRPGILLFEEPELYVHPHLLRRYRDVLRKIGEKEGWQVVLTTHSPIMVDVGHDAEGLVIARRPSPTQAPTFHQVSADPFGNDADSRSRLRAVLDFHPTSAEAFFATNVLLAEGDSELAIFGGGIDWPSLPTLGLAPARDLTVVNCGGKWTIPAFMKVLAAFKIPFKVLHDLDAKGRPAEELATLDGVDPYRANARIAAEVNAASAAGLDARVHVVADTLEDVLWATRPPTKRDKPYRAWQRAKELHAAPAQILDSFKMVLLFVYGPREAPAPATPAPVANATPPAPVILVAPPQA